MESSKVNLFLATNADYLPIEKTVFIREQLSKLSDEQFATISMISFKNPTTALLLSIFLGCIGVDRFYVGNIGLGVLKLITGAFCFIWYIIDWFLIIKATKEENFKKLRQILLQIG